jgi:hypothetical protein
MPSSSCAEAAEEESASFAGATVPADAEASEEGEFEPAAAVPGRRYLSAGPGSPGFVSAMRGRTAPSPR